MKVYICSSRVYEGRGADVSLHIFGGSSSLETSKALCLANYRDFLTYIGRSDPGDVDLEWEAYNVGNPNAVSTFWETTDDENVVYRVTEVEVT
jgi:hypothetical protein